MLWQQHQLRIGEEVLVRPPPRLRSPVPSPFVVGCLERLPRGLRGFAGDFGAGYGRHARLLASMGYTVVALDLDDEALNTLGVSTARQRKGRARERIYPVMVCSDRRLRTPGVVNFLQGEFRQRLAPEHRPLTADLAVLGLEDVEELEEGAEETVWAFATKIETLVETSLSSAAIAVTCWPR